jgi:hypothetical protein
MSKRKRELNPKVVKGDKIMCLYMDGESSVPMGTNGVVSRVIRDPFEADGEIIEVKWDNGSNLSLISVTDSWVKVDENQIKESLEDEPHEYFMKNPEIFENFDYKFLREFLNKLREAGPVNMLQVDPFLYSGREWIDRYYGENQEDNEYFQEVLEMADEAKDKMIQGVLSYMDSQDMDVDLDKVNRLMKKFATKIKGLYIAFS